MRYLSILTLIIAIGLTSCDSGETASAGETQEDIQAPTTPAAANLSSELLPYFQAFQPGDTLFVEIEDIAPDADTIPTELLWAELDSSIWAEIAYGPEPETLIAVGRGYWEQDNRYRACWMQIEQYWWKFQYVLLYDLQDGEFADIQTLAEFYGGEGGQIATASFLFDEDGDGDRDILCRTSEHFLEMLNMDEGEVKEHISEEVYLWKWENNSFQEESKIDSAGLVKAFPVEWGW